MKKRGMLLVLVVIGMLVMVVGGVSFCTVDADCGANEVCVNGNCIGIVPYTEAQIRGSPIKDYLADISTATKRCIELNPNYPIVVSIGQPTKADVSTLWRWVGDSINGEWVSFSSHNMLDSSNCLTSDYKVSFTTKTLAKLRTLTCREAESGEISRLDEPNTIMLGPGDFVEPVEVTSVEGEGILFGDRYFSDVETGKEMCELAGYSELIDFKINIKFNEDWHIYRYNPSDGTWNFYESNIYPFMACLECRDCTSNCAGKNCGDDGCGGSCGTCDNPPLSYCSSAQQCVACLENTHCDDSIDCTVDTCIINPGLCSHLPDNSLCDDGNSGTEDICLLTGCVNNPLGVPYWANMNGGVLGSDVVEAQVGDTVKLVLTNTGLSEGTEVTFNVKEDDLIFDDLVTPITGSVDATGTAIGKWTIPENWKDYEPVGLPEFYFEVRGLNSKILKIGKTEANSNLDSIIGLPGRESNFTVLTNPINFNHVSSDEDDDLQVLWDWNYGSDFGIGIDCLMNGVCDFTKTYSETGTKMIRLGTNEMGSIRNNFKNYTSRVFVFKEGLNIFSIIDSPDYKNEYDGKSPGMYTFDGSRSYVASCVAFGTGCSTDYYEIEDSLSGNKLCCKRESGVLALTWEVTNLNTGLIKNPLEPSKYLFTEYGNYRIKLTVTDSVRSISDYSDVYLNIESSLYRCERGADFSKWVKEGYEEYTVKDGKVEEAQEKKCYKSSESLELFCCPNEGWICETADNDYYHSCIPTNANYCEDLKNEGDCNAHSPYMAEASVERVSESKCGILKSWEEDDETYCYTELECSCVWEMNDDIGEETCKTKEKNITYCANVPHDEPTDGECIWTLNEWKDECSNAGYISAKWTAVPRGAYDVEGNNICIDKVKKISCEDVEKLSFFSTTSLILSIISIISIYFISSRFKR